jgi:CRP/FNR family transcriptional regulator
MKTPYGLRVIEDCLTCPLLKDRLFCDLPPSILKSLDAISSVATYPKAAVLFVEGQEPRGVFILCNGRVKLSGGSEEGKSLIFRIAEVGEIIGLPGTISNQPYELTAEALEPTQANFIRRDDFLLFLREHGDAALRVAETLSNIYYATCREVRYLGLSNSAAESLARFLLDLIASKKPDNGHVRASLTLTHEEIAQMIGSSRETVSRLFASFKRKKLIEVHGSILVVLDQLGLKKILQA